MSSQPVASFTACITSSSHATAPTTAVCRKINVFNTAITPESKLMAPPSMPGRGGIDIGIGKGGARPFPPMMG